MVASCEMCLARSNPGRYTCPLLAVFALVVTLQPLGAQEKPARLLDRQPFDRVTLDAANGGETIEIQLLDLPSRQVPNPLPSEGSLELRRLSEPSVLYTVDWSAIARVETYEQLLLQEAISLATARELAEAFEYLNFLHRNYPDLAGLKAATAKYLQQDALETYGKRSYEETLTILLALYDLDPQQRGLGKFVDTVTERLITQHLADRNYAAARSVLDSLSAGFPKLQLRSIDNWQQKFATSADRQIARSRQAIDAGQFTEARQAIRQALAILPGAAGAKAIQEEINRLSPQIVVAVDQLGMEAGNRLEWANNRVAQLIQPNFVQFADFGAEGGIYSCRWAKILSDDTGKQLDMVLNDTAQSKGISAGVLALALLQRANPSQPQFRTDFAGLLKEVQILESHLVRIHWHRPHVRPQSLLTIPLGELTTGEITPGSYLTETDNEAPEVVTFELADQNPSGTAPKTIVERHYENEELAITDLLRGEVDAISRVPPWQVNRLEQTEDIVVASYRLPSTQVLLLNYDNPLLGQREFRRALCYGIDRAQILNGIMLGGEARAGFRVLSAPLPAGVSLTDPVGYAYDQGLPPRAYEPRLAAVLAAVARNTLAKIDTSKKSNNEAVAGESQTVASEPPPLVLAHPPNAVATAVCQTIQLQLGAIGIPVKLLPLVASQTKANWDLRYAELAVWEPIVDARRLLGSNGLAGYCSSSMSLALGDVDQARNWKEARSRLQEVHQIAFNDVSVIPLWQTVKFFAHSKSLRGIGSTPVTLYQNLDQWQRSFGKAGR